MVIQIGVLICIAESSSAQTHSATATSGGQLKGERYRLSFTIGQTVTETFEGEGIMLTQGFQQPRVYVSNIQDVENKYYKLEAYPNPVKDLLKLSSKIQLPHHSKYYLFNQNGFLIQNGNIKGLETTVSFKGLPPATYFIEVTHETKTLKTFKILKLN